MVAELSELVNVLANKLKVIDIEYVEEVVGLEELNFNVAIASVLENDLSNNHIAAVYERLRNTVPDFVQEIIKLQLQYEVVHALRIQLHKKFADNYLGDRQEVKLKPHEYSMNTVPFARNNFEFWIHPDSSHSKDITDESGYRYNTTQIKYIVDVLPPEVKTENKDLLNAIGLMHGLEMAYEATISYPIQERGYRNIKRLKDDLTKNIDLACQKALKPVV